MNDQNYAKLKGSFINDGAGNANMNQMSGSGSGVNRMDDYDDEDDDDYRDGDYGAQGFMNEMDFMTWDLIVKNTPKLA